MSITFNVSKSRDGRHEIEIQRTKYKIILRLLRVYLQPIFSVVVVKVISHLNFNKPFTRYEMCMLLEL